MRKDLSVYGVHTHPCFERDQLRWRNFKPCNVQKFWYCGEMTWKQKYGLEKRQKTIWKSNQGKLNPGLKFAAGSNSFRGPMWNQSWVLTIFVTGHCATCSPSNMGTILGEYGHLCILQLHCMWSDIQISLEHTFTYTELKKCTHIALFTSEFTYIRRITSSTIILYAWVPTF